MFVMDLIERVSIAYNVASAAGGEIKALLVGEDIVDQIGITGESIDLGFASMPVRVVEGAAVDLEVANLTKVRINHE